MTTSSSTEIMSPFSLALAAFCFGYGAKSVGGDLQDLIILSPNVIMDSFLVPVYTNLVILYLALRSYDKLKVFVQKRKEASSSKPQQDDEAMRLARNAKQPVDLTGTFKLIQNENFGEFLAAQGVPWALRGAANAARPTHVIRHTGNIITIAIRGPIHSSTTYTIGASPIPAKIRGRRFEDSVSYIQSGVCTTKRACDDGYTVTVERVLSPDQQEIRMKSTVEFDDASKETVESFQLFQRIE